jgi:2-oxoglutarate dehydrogenase E2 component (dihydrolipoamide succinyltransferase)
MKYLEAKAAAGPPENKALAGPPENKVGGAEIDATDAARALAAENGIDLASVRGSGADGRITVGDVRAVLEAGS